MWKRFKKWYYGIPGTKQHLDAIIAFLTVLLFTTTLIINIKNLQGGGKPTPTPVPPIGGQQIVVVSASQSKQPTPIPTANTATCNKGIGNISIDSPQEGETISANPVCITINYNQGNYCSSVWQYRINGGAWSSFSNDSPCFYNIQSGSVIFDLNVKSLVSSSAEQLTRTFTYQPPQSATSSATVK